MRTSIPNPTTRGMIGANQFNQLVEVSEGATYRGKAHKTTRGVIPRMTPFAAKSSGSPFTHPLQVYLEGGYICVRAGHHIWFNEVSNAHDREDLGKTSLDAWQAYTSGGRTVFVKRIYNSDGTATVTLENTADSYITTLGQINNTTAIWILATIADSVITQWWTGGDIYELRVA